jgi:hypothetical protein
MLSVEKVGMMPSSSTLSLGKVGTLASRTAPSLNPRRHKMSHVCWPHHVGRFDQTHKGFEQV